MRFVVNFLIILVATALLQLFLPWWMAALVPFAVSAWRSWHPGSAFAVSFAAVATVWLAYGLFLHNATDGGMSNRIAQLFSLPNGLALLAVATLVGGLVAGVSGLAGYFVGQLFARPGYAVR